MPLPRRKTALRRKTPLRPRTPKYKSNVTTILVEGEKHTYHSRFESGYARLLHDLKKQGKLVEVREQYRVKLTAHGKHICTHLPDFLVTLPDGRQKFVEAKGYKTDVWQIKKRLIEAQIPEIPYLVNPTEEEILR